MIRVIKMGTKQSRTCYACGCYFNFSNEDIRDIDEETLKGTILCPQCGKIINAKAMVVNDEKDIMDEVEKGPVNANEIIEKMVDRIDVDNIVSNVLDDEDGNM